jgi:acyl CoA:acetate/3-ketoacid CoA transferase beta subunit
MADYNQLELMICVAARNLEDGSTVVVGRGTLRYCDACTEDPLS